MLLNNIWNYLRIFFGKTLLRTHYFRKGIEHMETALGMMGIEEKDEGTNFGHMSIAECHFSLGDFKKGYTKIDKVINDVPVENAYIRGFATYTKAEFKFREGLLKSKSVADGFFARGYSPSLGLQDTRKLHFFLCKDIYFESSRFAKTSSIKLECHTIDSPQDQCVNDA